MLYAVAALHNVTTGCETFNKHLCNI